VTVVLPAPLWVPAMTMPLIAASYTGKSVPLKTAQAVDSKLQAMHFKYILDPNLQLSKKIQING
jgi:hypothetical protein